MKAFDIAGGFVIAFFLWLHIVALHDESQIRDSISVTNGLLQLQEAGK